MGWFRSDEQKERRKERGENLLGLGGGKKW